METYIPFNRTAGDYFSNKDYDTVARTKAPHYSKRLSEFNHVGTVSVTVMKKNLTDYLKMFPAIFPESPPRNVNNYTNSFLGRCTELSGLGKIRISYYIG